MADGAVGYSKGDWLVHCYHGLGRVREIESKRINGEEAEYYRVEAADAVFWVPVEESKDSHVRPVTPRRKLMKALKLLKTPPKKMADAYQKRQQRIRAAKNDGSIDAICSIIRDLTGRRMEKGLNENEKRALGFFKGLLLNEWSVSAEVPPEDAQRELRELLKANEALSKEDS
jgi:RNA polymerase-interacting CarD/CdnL/TRCF family regulator